ncbi:MAG: hypothetical protein V1843_02805, partial [bacterium]
KNILLIIAMLFLLAITISGCDSLINLSNQGGNTPTSSIIKAVWMYNIATIDNTATTDALKNMGINTVFLSVDDTLLPGGSSYSATYTDKVKDFITKANTNSISTHAMILEAPTYTYTTNHTSALSHVQTVINFCKNNTATAFSGIHIDVEPHALPEWTTTYTGTQEALMQQYISLLSQIHDLIKGSSGLSSLNFSAAIAYWYNEKYLEGVLPSGSAANIARYVDTMIPMAYATTLPVYNQSSDEVAAGPAIVGIDASNYSTYASISREITSLNANFAASANYRGACVFKYDTLKALYDAQ